MENYRITSVKKSRKGVTVTLENTEYPDDVQKLTMSEDMWQSLPFGKDDALTAGETDEIRRLIEHREAKLAADRILDFAGNSRTALVRKLRQRGFSAESAESAADTAESDGLLNESRDAKSKAEYYLRHKRWGKRRISAELFAKGYGRTAVSEAIDSLDEDAFAENLLYLIEKKPAPSGRDELKKYVAAFCRMGYSAGQVVDAIKASRNHEK